MSHLGATLAVVRGSCTSLYTPLVRPPQLRQSAPICRLREVLIVAAVLLPSFALVYAFGLYLREKVVGDISSHLGATLVVVRGSCIFLYSSLVRPPQLRQSASICRHREVLSIVAVLLPSFALVYAFGLCLREKVMTTYRHILALRWRSYVGHVHLCTLPLSVRHSCTNLHQSVASEKC